MYFTLPQTPEKLTATEQSIIEYIASHRDEFLFMSIGQLSDALTVSEATISRFARHVGCCDFKHLKRVIMEQTVQKGAARKLANTLQAESDDFLTFCLEQQQYNLKKTLELLDRSEFDNAVEAIHTARRVFIYVKNASRAPAQLLEFRLRRIGIDVQKIPSGGSELLEWLAQMGEGDPASQRKRLLRLPPTERSFAISTEKTPRETSYLNILPKALPEQSLNLHLKYATQCLTSGSPLRKEK